MGSHTDLSSSMDERIAARVDALLSERLQSAIAEELSRQKKRHVRRLAIIASKGTLDFAYPPLILATAGAAMEWEVGIFFTFYGLNIIHKDKSKRLEVAPIGNPAMPMPMPMPQFVTALPGMVPMATTMIKSLFRQHNVETIDTLLASAVESGVRIIPCSMTADVFGYKATDFIEGAEDMCGAASFLRFAADADIQLFI